MQRRSIQLCAATRTTMVYITHNVGEAVFLADRVLVLKANPIELERRLRDAIPDSDSDEGE